MNVNDEKNKTATVGVCYDLVAAQKVRGGGHVTIGVPESVVMDLLFNSNKIPILLIVDKSEYDKLK